MNPIRPFLLTAFLLANTLMSYDEPTFTVTTTEGNFSVRQYAGYVQAALVLEGAFEEVGYQAHKLLAGYISGKNQSMVSIEMAAPVTQQPVRRKIEMATPVTQQDAGEDTFKLAFVMPRKWTLETLPMPEDQRIRLEAVPPTTFAVVKYAGGWSKKRYEKNLSMLRDWIHAQGWSIISEPLWARYNSPFMPTFWRRNEILLEFRETPPPPKQP